MTENEVQNGILQSKSDPKDSCIAVLRDIPDIQNHLDHVQAPRFIDTVSNEAKLDEEANGYLKQLRDERLKEKIPDNNMTRVTVEWNSSGANVSVEKAENVNVAESAQAATPDKESTVVKHKQYLDSLCKEFYDKASKLIRQGGVKSSKTYDEIVTEVLQHQHFAKIRCEVFEGREDVLDEIQNYLTNGCRLPLVIFGNSGCGKTTVMARLFEVLSTELQNVQAKPDVIAPIEEQTTKTDSSTGSDVKDSTGPIPLLLLRFLGTTPLTSTIQQVLVSLCKQIARIHKKSWEEPDKFSDLVKSFHKILNVASKEQPIILLIDSVDQLMPAYNAYKVNWLPAQLPEHVKVIVSTLDEGYPIYDTLKAKYEPEGGKLIQIKPLGENVGMTIIQKWLRMTGRAVTPEQEGVVKQALTICSLPLYARIAFDQIRRWRSFDKPTTEELKPTIQVAITKHFEAMETKFGAPLVKHCLAFLTASRYGLSEMELEHVLSLDDQLLGEIYKFWRPPIRRIPPLLWTRVRNEINYYIVERSADDILVLAWYHRQFIAATKARYLSDPNFSTYIHTILAEYFLGIYGGGKAKPFEYTGHQKTRFKLDSTKSEEDRKVPSQPYYTESNFSGEVTVRFNQRKLSELPLHLLKSKQHDLLRKEIFFNYEWLYAKQKATSARSLLQEYELFMLADKTLRKDPELKLLFANLQLIRPYISVYPDTLSLELTGRLAKHVGYYQSVTHLIKQCDSLGPKHCPITPAVTMYRTADIGLKQNLNFRDTDNWHEGGAMTCSRDFKTMYLVDYDVQGFSYLSIWDINGGEKISERTIEKFRGDGATDIYIDIFLDNSETLLIGAFKMKYYNRINEDCGAHRFTGNGYIEVIKIEDCTILYSYDDSLHKQDFYNCDCYMRDNWLSFRFGWHLPVLNFKGEEEKIQLTNPNMLTHDEKYFITICGRKIGVKSYQGENKVTANVRTKCATIKEFETKANQAEFDKTEKMRAIAITKDNKSVLLGDVDGNINVYDIDRVSEGKLFKVKRTLSLARNHKLAVTEKMEKMQGNENVHADYRIKLVLSPNEDFVLGIYQTCYDTSWEVVLWNLSNGKDLGHIAKERPTKAKYPVFNHDGSMVVMAELKEVRLFASATGQQVKVYDIGQEIRDMAVSLFSPQMALMLAKDIMFLDTNAMDGSQTGELGPKRNRRKGGKVAAAQVEGSTGRTSLLPRELITNTDICNEVILEKLPGKSDVQIVEKEGIIESVDLGGLSSARSMRNVPLDTWETPDGCKVLQLRNKVQVIDTKDEEVKYTPRTGDVIMRTSQQPAAPGQQASTESLEIPNLTGSISANPVMELIEGDRIVGEGNKTRLRVTSNTKGRMKIITVPSIISIGALDETGDKIKRLRRITVYQESIVAVSNHHVVTLKKKSSADYINVYGVDGGRLMATHAVVGIFGCARISTDEKHLYVASKDRSLRVYSGQMFLIVGRKLEASVSAKPINYVIRDIITFPLNADVVVMKYSEEGAAGMTVNSYIQLNMSTQERSPAIVVKPMLEDISRDGSIGIDNQLNMYNLAEGQIYKKLPYVNAGINMQLQVRISDDKKYVVLLDVNDDTLHVIKMAGQSAKHLATCFTHAPDLSTISGFSLRQSGRAILVRGEIPGLLIIRDPSEEVKEKGKLKYHSETQRATSLLAENEIMAPKSIGTSVSETSSSDGQSVTLKGTAVIQDFISSL